MEDILHKNGMNGIKKEQLNGFGNGFSKINGSNGSNGKNLNSLKELWEEIAQYELAQWRKPSADFDTLAISETIDPGTFSKNSMVMPIVTSSVFISHESAAEPNSVRHYFICTSLLQSDKNFI
jgi:hypothetical protein